MEGALDDHPTPEVLKRWLEGRLAQREARPLVRHLVQGCGQCQAELAASPVLLQEEDPPEREVEEGTEAPGAYDLAIRRAFEGVRLHGTRAREIKKASARILRRLTTRGLDSVNLERDDPYAVFEALLARVWALRHEDPQQMLRLARVAVWAARLLKGYPPDQCLDYQARSWVELANAFRVVDQLGQAEDSLEKAEEFFAAGTGDPELSLRLKEVRASILGARCCYSEALDLLEEVHRGRANLGDRLGALRTLIQRAVFCGYAGRHETEITLLEEAAALALNLGEDQLGTQIVHNKIHALIELDRSDEALRLLEQNQALYTADRVDRYRLIGLEGRIHMKLGHLDIAERAFRESRNGFREIVLRAHEALLSLDLATVILRQGQDRYVEAVTLAIEAVQVFSQLKIRDHVVESLLVLSDAIQQGLVTAELLESVAEFVRRADHDRRARYVPRFR
jgi:tetratricopeptide (TPR) repeat protein